MVLTLALCAAFIALALIAHVWAHRHDQPPNQGIGEELRLVLIAMRGIK